MNTVAIVTDSASGITQKEAKELGIHVVPMPFYINSTLYYEDVNLTQDDFYQMLSEGAEISTSQPSPGELMDVWDELLKNHSELVYIPISSGLSSSCATATALAEDYDGRVEVVNNQRVSVTQRQSVLLALQMSKDGASAAEIHAKLMETKFDSSIYIMLNTLTYLRRGGRLTPAAAAIGTLLRLKPVLQIQGEKLDAFRNARSVKQARKIMIDAVKEDAVSRFGGIENCEFHLAYTDNLTDLEEFRAEAMAAIPGLDESRFHFDPLPLNISCHIGPGALALTCAKIHR